MTETNKPRARPQRRELSHSTIISARPHRNRDYVLWDTMQIGLGLRVRRSGHKSFVFVYQYRGESKWHPLGRFADLGLAEARDEARRVRRLVKQGRDPQGEKVAARLGETLEQVHQQYLEKKAKKTNKSWRQGAALMEKHVLRAKARLGKRKLKDITRKDIWRIYDELHDRPSLANSVLAAASAVFTWALKRDLIDKNPCSGVERNKTRPSSRFLSNDEIRAVWPVFDDLGLYQSIVLKLILLTGQRPGEVSAMRWEHVDLKAGLWSMPGEPSTSWPGTKNARDHEVPLTAPVLELLHDLDPKPSGYVFPSGRPGKHIARVLVQPVYTTADVKRFVPHSLRATAATKMDQLGIIKDHVRLVLNHADNDVTASYIRHDKIEHKRAALEAWATELAAILEGTGKTDQTAEVLPLDRPRRRLTT